MSIQPVNIVTIEENTPSMNYENIERIINGVKTFFKVEK